MKKLFSCISQYLDDCQKWKLFLDVEANYHVHLLKY